ncbi:lytic transglycosylase domain-containing protein [Actinomadura keratinilytica]|uniref:lytic transglycosylase domain-containing protein n=1 Tax=Actinomadura keratinilytica TaxID=547461 RepID=UPI00360F3CF3
MVTLLFGGGAANACPSGGTANQPEASEEANSIPRNYLRLYQQAGQKYGIPWNVLAGIGKVETDHGRSNLPGVKSGENSAGAGGPMQFLQSTWNAYGVDGNGDGRKDRYDPEDAIPGAANYLKASGAPEDMRKAIFAYNHADWYVDDVLEWADKYAKGNFEVGGDNGSAAECEPGPQATGSYPPARSAPRGRPWAPRTSPTGCAASATRSRPCSRCRAASAATAARAASPAAASTRWAGPATS